MIRNLSSYIYKQLKKGTIIRKTHYIPVRINEWREDRGKNESRRHFRRREESRCSIPSIVKKGPAKRGSIRKKERESEGKGGGGGRIDKVDGKGPTRRPCRRRWIRFRSNDIRFANWRPDYTVDGSAAGVSNVRKWPLISSKRLNRGFNTRGRRWNARYGAIAAWFMCWCAVIRRPRSLSTYYGQDDVW